MRNRKTGCEVLEPLPVSYSETPSHQHGTDYRHGTLHYSTRSPIKGQTPDTYSPSSSSGYSGSDVDDTNDDTNDDVKSETMSSNKETPKCSLGNQSELQVTYYIIHLS